MSKHPNIANEEKAASAAAVLVSLKRCCLRNV
jgi:hypothetical protein